MVQLLYMYNTLQRGLIMIKKIISIMVLVCFFVSCTAAPMQTAQPEKPRPKLTWYINFSWFNNVWGEDPVSREITDRTNINVEYIVPTGNEQERLSSMIASHNLPDILTMGWWESAYLELLGQDMLAPLNQLAQEYEPLFFNVADEQRLNWYSDDNGDIYGYPNASYSPFEYETESNQSFLVRKDIYEAIGSPDMSTPEGFLKALNDAREYCPTVNGEPLIPIGLQEFTEVGCSAVEEYLQNFLAIPFEKNGEIYDRYTDPDYIQWLKTFRKANEMGLLSRDIFVDKRIQMEEKIAKKRYFAMLYQWSDCQTQLKSIYNQSPNESYIAIDGPKNSKGDDHRLSGPGIQGWTLTMISKNSPHKEEAIKLITALMSEEGQRLLWAGIQGHDYDLVDNKVVFRPEMLQLLQTDRYKFDREYGSAATHWPLMDNAMASSLGFRPPDDEIIMSIKNWTTKYTVNNSVYSFTSFEPGSDAAIAKNKIDLLKGKVIPALLLAKNDEEFDALFNEFLREREQSNFEAMLEEQQKQIEENKKRLGL